MNSVHMQANSSLMESITIMKSCSYDSNESVMELLLHETSTTFTTEYCYSERTLVKQCHAVCISQWYDNVDL